MGLSNYLSGQEYVSLFLLIPIYIAFTAMAYFFYQNKLSQIFGPAQLKKLTSPVSWLKLLFKKGLLLIGLLSLIIAITDPRWGESEEKRSRLNTDLIISVDVSSSMLVEDIQPNRLEKVKLKINEIIGLQKGTRVGITVFAGSSFIYTPLTTDYNSLQEFVKNISTEMVSKQGTDLTLGMKISLQAFMDNDAQKILAVFTDGENHNQDYQQIVEEYVEKDIVVFMVGVGSPNGEKIPIRNELGVITDYLRDSGGTPVISKLDYATLSDITKKTGGTYFPLTAEQDDLLAINDFILQSQTNYEEGEGVRNLTPRYQIFAAITFFALLIEMLVGTQRRYSKNIFSFPAFLKKK